GCDEPYIGEESIMRPPASKKAAMTPAHSSRSTCSPPTLKVIQLPSPTIGIASRVEGIGRRAGRACWACREIGKSAAAAVAREDCTNVRRVVRIRCSISVAGKLRTRRPQSMMDSQTSLDALQSPQTCVTVGEIFDQHLPIASVHIAEDPARNLQTPFGRTIDHIVDRRQCLG